MFSFAKVRPFDLVGFQKLRDGLVHAADVAKHVAVHVLGVRNIGGEFGVSLCVRQSILEEAIIFIAVNQKMMRGEVVGIEGQHSIEKCGRLHITASLPVGEGRRLLRHAAKEKKHNVIGISGECVIKSIADGQLAFDFARDRSSHSVAAREFGFAGVPCL